MTKKEKEHKRQTYNSFLNPLHHDRLILQCLGWWSGCRGLLCRQTEARNSTDNPVPAEYRGAGNAERRRHSLTSVRQTRSLRPQHLHPLQYYLWSLLLVRISHGVFPPLVTCPVLQIRLADPDQHDVLS